MGCCLGLLLLAGAPRLALALWWLMDPQRVIGTFGGWSTTVGTFTAPVWAWPLVGLLLVPWTTVAFIFVAPGGVIGLEWVVLAIGALIDLGVLGGGGNEYSRRRSAV